MLEDSPFSDFNETWIFLTFEKQISYFMKIRPVGTELIHADRWTDTRTEKHNEANSRFSKFCESA
jgi:hypothetical protein